MKLVHIFGSSGSGTTTLARAICERFGYKMIDIDDVFWEKTDPPFTLKRPEKERIDMIESILKDHDKVVMSGAFVGWGDVFIPRLNLAVYLHMPLDVRIARVMHREAKRFGSRVLPGGDLYDQHMDFLEWIKSYDDGDETTRSKKQHQSWMLRLPCPVIKIESVKTIDELIEIVAPYLQ